MTGGGLAVSPALQAVMRSADAVNGLKEIATPSECEERAALPVKSWYTVDQPECYLAVAISSCEPPSCYIT